MSVLVNIVYANARDKLCYYFEKTVIFGCLHEYQNVTVISGDWKSQALSDVQIRSFYQHARLGYCSPEEYLTSRQGKALRYRPWLVERL